MRFFNTEIAGLLLLLHFIAPNSGEDTYVVKECYYKSAKTTTTTQLTQIKITEIGIGDKHAHTTV